MKTPNTKINALQGKNSIGSLRLKKLGVYSLLGGECRECGIKDERVLQIDHRYSDGNKERGLTRTQLYKKVMNNSRRYQLLCANCNWKKRTKDNRVQSNIKARGRFWKSTKIKIVAATLVTIFIIGIGVYEIL